MHACFYRSYNAIFGKIGKPAPENVIVHLVKTKCLNALLYGVEACSFNRPNSQM